MLNKDIILSKHRSQKKALVAELGSFILTAIIIVLIIIITFVATSFLIKKDPIISINPAKYARNEIDFSEKKYIEARNEKAAIVAQALLSSEREFDGKKMKVKDAVQEWVNAIAAKDEKKKQKIEETIKSFFREIIERSSAEQKPTDCFYFKILSEKNNGERILVSSYFKETEKSFGSGTEETRIIGENIPIGINSLISEKAAIVQIKTNIGNVDFYFNYGKDVCWTERPTRK